MADIKLTIDDSDIIQALDNIDKKLAKTGEVADGLFDGAFNVNEAAEAVKVLNSLEKEFNDIKKSADTLKAAMRNATDPDIIKSYAANIAKLEKGMEELAKAGKTVGVNLGQANKEAGTGKQVFEGFFGQFTKVTLIIAAVEAVRKFASQAVSIANQIEKANKQFEAFLGNAEAASKIVGELQSFASKKILPTQDVLDAGKGLLAFGEAGGNIVPVLGRIADISRATGKNFGELTTIYGKARAAGVLYAEDINQLVDAGIPIIGEFAKQMGVSTGEVKKLASEGKISFEQLQLAFFNLTAEGGKFAGQAEAGIQAGDKFDAAWTKALTQVGGVLKPAWDFVLNSLASIVNSITSLGESKGLEDFARKFFNFFGEVNPLFALLKKQIENTFPAAKGKIEIDYTGRDAYEQAKDDLFERERLEKAADETRNKRNKLTAKEIAAIEKEKSSLRVQALKEGEEKEIAIENLRFSELKKQLEKYHIDTKEAEFQHQKNITDIVIRYANERADNEAKLIALRRAQGEFEEKQAKDAEKAALARAKTEKEISEIRIDTTEAEFANLIATLEAGGAKEADIKQAQSDFDKHIKAERIEAEIAYQKQLLALSGSGVTADLIQAEIDKLEVILAGIEIPEPKPKDGKPVTLLSLLGIKFDDPEQEKLIQESIGRIIDSLNELGEARIKEAEATTQAADEKVKAAEDALDKENDLAKQGLANNSDIAKKALDDAKKARDIALKEEEKVKKQQIALDSAVQLSSLITTAANIFKGFSTIPILGQVLAVVSVAAMFASFAAAKASALKAASAPKLRKGRRFDGPTHEAGNEDMVFDGRKAYAVEKDEWLIGTEHSREHNAFLSKMNKGEFKGVNLLEAIGRAKSDHDKNPLSESSPRIRRMEERLTEAREQNQYQILAKAYERGADRITKEIREKPVIAPWKQGYKMIRQTDGGTDTKTVQPE